MYDSIKDNQKRQRNLYIFLLVACLVGYIWLYYNLSVATTDETPGVCLFKTATGIPCPSCGSSRSTLEILSGNFKVALLINPLGYIITMGLIILPVWIVADLSFKSDSFYRTYLRIENYLKIRVVAVFLILLIITNWIWNIIKGL